MSHSLMSLAVSEKLERPRKFHLLDPTESNIASTRALETRKNIIKDEDDIWWEKRGTRVHQKTFHYRPANENTDEEPIQRRSKSASRVRESIDGQESLSQEALIYKQKYLKGSYTVSQISPSSRLLVSNTITNTRKQQVEEILKKTKNGSKSPSVAASVRNFSDTLSVKSEGKPEKKPQWTANHETLVDSSLTQVLAGSKHKFNVPSKLHQPTTATTSGAWKKPNDKSPDKYHSSSSSVFSSTSTSTTPNKNTTSTTPASKPSSENGVTESDTVDEIPSPVDKEVERLLEEFTSRLTRPTKATERGQWKKEELAAKSPARRKSLCSAEVTNRLTRPTTATINGKWNKDKDPVDTDAGTSIVNGTDTTTDEHPVVTSPAPPRPSSSSSKPPPDVSRLTRPTKATTRGAWKKSESHEVESEEAVSLSPTRQSQSQSQSGTLPSTARRTPDVDRLTRPTTATIRGIWHKPEVTDEEAVEVKSTPTTTRPINPDSHLFSPTTASIHQRLSKPTTATTSSTTPERRRPSLNGASLSLSSLSQEEGSELVDQTSPVISVGKGYNSPSKDVSEPISSPKPLSLSPSSTSPSLSSSSRKSPSYPTLHRSPSERSQTSVNAVGLSHDWNADEEEELIVVPPAAPTANSNSDADITITATAI